MFKTLNSVVAKALNLDKDFWKPEQSVGLDSGDIEKIVEQAIKKPFNYYVWVYSCVRSIYQSLGTLPRRIQDTRTKKFIETTNEPFTNILNNANSNSKGSQFIDEIIVRLLLDGQVFIVGGNKDKLGIGVIPSELFIIPQKYMSVIRDKATRFIMGWVYQPEEGVKISYLNEEVIRVRFIDPYNDESGMPPLRAAMIGTNNDLRAASYNANFFRNQAQLSGTLETDERLTEDQARPIAEQFKTKYSGSDKAGSVALLHSGLKYNVTASTHKDMQYENQRNWNKNEILAAFGVPKNLLADYADQNYSNSVMAFKGFWEHTLIPIDTVINMIITYSWVSKYNPNWDLKTDYSSVEALQAIAKEKVDAWDVLVKGGVHPEEASRLLNIPIDWDNNSTLEDRDSEEDTEEDTEEPINEEQQDEENTEDVEDYEKALQRRYNSITTDLRNRCMDEFDKGKTPRYSVEDCFNRQKEQLDGSYMNLIRNTCSKVFDAKKLLTILNESSYDFKKQLNDIVESIGGVNNKRDIHDIFQSQFSKNKELAHNNVASVLGVINEAVL